MSTLSKKLVSATLSTVTAVTMSGVLAFAPVANAQTDAAAQIAALMAQIAALQAQLGGGASAGTSACTFTRTLTPGSKGSDVTCLQNALISKGYLAAGLNTGFYGQLTKAAVIKWQTAAGVSPASGIFGPLSRAAFASQGGSTGGNTGGNTGGVVPGSGVAVSLASDSPMGSAIAGAGQIEVGRWNLTAAASAPATVTGLTFNKLGVLSDTQINNLYLADPMTGAVIAQYNSLSNGVATFSGLNLSVGAGQTVKVALRMDLSSGASAGNTISWSLASVTAGGAAVSGVPSASNSLTVTTVSNPSLATMTWNFGTVGSTVDAGTNNVQIATAAVNVANSPVWLRSVKFSLVGSANYADIRNLKLMVNGSQVGATVAQANADGSVLFSLGSNPVKLNTGSATVDLNADVAGSPNRNITVRILRPYDLYVTDSQYNSGVSPTVTDDSNAVTINSGQITFQLASNTPNGNIPKGASGVTLAKFTIFASGEAVKVKFVDLTITQASAGDDWDTLANVTEDIQNIQLVDDAGNQVGSTISTVSSGSTNGTCTLAADVITCHLGTSSSPINYIVPANTTRVLSAKVDILSTNDATTLRAGLAAGSSNLEGQTSFQTTSSGAVNGAVMTVVNSPLTVAANGGFAAPTYVAGANNVRIASFVITASSAEGARVNSITVDKDSDATMDIQNMKVMVGSTQFGSTKPTIGDAETSLVFSGSSPIVVPAGGSVTVDVYADILGSTTATTKTATIDFTSWTAVGSVSNSSIDFTSAQNGQNVVISSGPTLTVAAAGETASAKQIVMGTTGNSLLSVLLTANNVEDVNVTQMSFLDTVSGTTSTGQTSWAGVTLWDGATQIGGTLSPTMAGATTSTVTFSFSTPVAVAKNTSKVLTLKGDVADFSSGAVSGSVHTLSLTSTSTVVAYGKDSNTSATVTGSASGNAQSVYRTKLSFTSATLGASSGRVRTAVDDLAQITWTANSAYQVVLNTVTLKFSGSAVSSGSTAFTVDLLKSDGTALGSATQQTCTPGAGNSCSVSFGPAFTISGGASQVSKVRVNSASFYDAASLNESLSVTVNAAGDVLWSDGTTTGITLEASAVPATIGSFQY